MRRLYRSIYLTILASLVAVVIVAGALLRFGPGPNPMGQGIEVAADFMAAALPDATRPAAEQEAALGRIAGRLHTDASLFDSDRRPIASAGRPLPPPRPNDDRSGFGFDRDGPAWSLRLDDGRWIVLRAPPRHRNPFMALLLFIAAVAGIVGLCAYPVVRGLTRRIERLQIGVETLGAGDLSARVKVEGKDEVAGLARSFNDAAARIEDLVGAHRMLLANASHELRTPLSRIRLGLELLQQTGDAKYRAALDTDLRELEDLIESLLVVSRLDATHALDRHEAVDLLALAAEEASHFESCNVEGEALTVMGDARLLRRLVRNLMENAGRHGAPPVEVRVTRTSQGASLEVRDRGQGIPPGLRERVFEPFYQARRDSGGVGLGLALVRRIARLHGGEARVLDPIGPGTRFEVVLPLSPA